MVSQLLFIVGRCGKGKANIYRYQWYAVLVTNHKIYAFGRTRDEATSNAEIIANKFFKEENGEEQDYI